MSLPAFLEREYARRRDRNRRYSLRAFARDLGCDHSTLSQWMRGKRVMTEQAAEAVCDALALHGIDRRRVRELDASDLDVFAAARESGARDCHALAAITGLGIDRLNLSLFKLMRLDVLRMNGAHWKFAAKELV